MPSKKKSKKKSSQKSAKKVRSAAVKSVAPRKRAVGAARRSAKKKPTPKRAVARPNARRRKRTASMNVESEFKREFQSRNRTPSGVASPRQSPEFEGSSRAERADSESVDELVEEGNLFEAGAVAGVQAADDADEREVQTHEVPQDDVPEEYLDKE